MNGHVEGAVLDHPDTTALQAADEGCHCSFVAGDHSRAEDHRVVGPQVQVRVIAGSKAVQGRAWLALAAGGNGQHLGGWQITQVAGADEPVCGIPDGGGQGGSVEVS